MFGSVPYSPGEDLKMNTTICYKNCARRSLYAFEFTSTNTQPPRSTFRRLPSSLALAIGIDSTYQSHDTFEQSDWRDAAPATLEYKFFLLQRQPALADAHRRWIVHKLTLATLTTLATRRSHQRHIVNQALRSANSLPHVHQ